jgi:hypothetical protein
VSDMSLQYVANRLTLWARGELASSNTPAVIFVPEKYAGWVSDPRSGVLGEGTLVLVRSKKAKLDGAGHIGTWIGYRGDLDEPGDEIRVGPDFWVQTIDYAATRYLSVAGPTVIRFPDADDVHAFAKDVTALRDHGHFHPALLHAAVEIGDRCLLTDTPCTRLGQLTRLYVDSDGVVRKAPRGLPLGSVGDPLDRLAAVGRQYAAAGLDPCAPEEISAVLRSIPLADRLMYLNSVDAIRTMQMRTGEPWYVSGVQGRVAAGDGGRHVLPHRHDLLLLWSDTAYVLFDARQHRAFTLQPEAAEIIDILLSTDSDWMAQQRLSGRAAVGGDPAAAIAALRAAIAKRGVRLDNAA